MNINDAFGIAMFVVTVVASLSAVAGYCIGRLHGFDLGQEAVERDGWMDEALWWRKNSTGIVGVPYVREGDGAAQERT